jgi:beta-glucosidase
MKKLLKITGIIAGSFIALMIIIILLTLLTMSLSGNRSAKKYKALAGQEAPELNIDGLSSRDLNKNGSLDSYEDHRQTVEVRVSDLLSQMTLEEKAGQMFFPPIGMNSDGSVSEKRSFSDPSSLMSIGSYELIFGKNISHFNIFMGTGKREMAEWYNSIQKLAGRTRLGIPVTIASDPRNMYGQNILASAFSGDFSLWPEPAGLAATGDSALVWQHADIARQEYLATGIRVALHPMADLATEPRWGRINGTFGEDALISAMFTAAYIRGFQGDSLGSASVACMTKHFSGGGPQREGKDPHFPVALGQIYPGNNFEYHLIPFEAAFREGTAAIMPYYGVPVGQTGEDVGMGFNREIITGLLRNRYGYDGVVCTDWGLVTDNKVLGINILPARARGMEHATPEERMLKIINAGCDQLGGEMIPDMLVRLVRDGKITEARLDSSVVRLLRLKFILGLFDDPYVDVEHSVSIIGNPAFVEAGRLAQRKSVVLLKNSPSGSGMTLPLREGIKIYVMNIDPVVASQYGTVVAKPDQADIALIRLRTPSQPLRGAGPLGRIFSSGDLDYKGKELKKILGIMTRVPTVVDIYLDRPAVIPEISEKAAGLMADFGAADDAVLDIVFGRFSPTGTLPFEMPSSMKAVRDQKEDLPYDSADPLFRFGFGLRYE